MKKKNQKVYVVWYITKSEKSLGWPTLNIAKPWFKTAKEALKALDEHQSAWPDEVVALRVMTKEQYKDAKNSA